MASSTSPQGAILGGALAHGDLAAYRNGTTESLEFDHVDASTKAFTITPRLTWSWTVLLPELRKCQLLCTPCHVAKGEHGGKSQYRTKVSA